MDQVDDPVLAALTSDAVAALNVMAAELSNIVATVDRVGDVSQSTMELLEASRSIHNALVFLGDWIGSREEAFEQVVSL